MNCSQMECGKTKPIGLILLNNTNSRRFERIIDKVDTFMKGDIPLGSKTINKPITCANNDFRITVCIGHGSKKHVNRDFSFWNRCIKDFCRSICLNNKVATSAGN